MDKQLSTLGDIIQEVRDELHRARRTIGTAAAKLDKVNDIRRELVQRDRCESRSSSNREYRGRNANRRGRSRRRSNDREKRSRRSRSRSPRRMQSGVVSKNSSPRIHVRETPKSPDILHDVNMYFVPNTPNPVKPSTVIPPCPELPNISTSEEDDDWSNPKTAIQILDEMFCDDTENQEPTLDDRIGSLIKDGLLKAK